MCGKDLSHGKQGNNQNESIYGAQFVDLGTNERAELGEFIMKLRAEQDGFINKKYN